MIIVTGGAGFIGSNIVSALNYRNINNILVVDNLTNAEKVKNLSDLEIADYMDKSEFARAMSGGTEIGAVTAVFHNGACSDTMAADGKYVLENNFTYSKQLFHFCQTRQAQYIYASSASVYGNGLIFSEQPENESALNAYAYSKLLFDNYVRRQDVSRFQCAGLRYFNVYGPREQHKGRMASVAWHFFHQYQKNKTLNLFQGSGGYEHGNQLRDFIFVDDIVKVNLFLYDHPDIRGIFNAGTGRCQSFNEVALAVINCCRIKDGEVKVSLREAVNSGEIQYIPMPDALHGKYQSYTCADMTRLRSVGYESSFDDVDAGVSAYLDTLFDAEPKNN